MGLWEIAQRRLDEQKRIVTKSGKPFFTSDLTTNEYLLTRESGCEPIGLVIGTSFYKVGFYGYFRGYRSQSGEIAALTHAQITARELAVSRMQSEATVLGAQGIIGVRLHRKTKGWNIGIVEFTAIGTAIRIPQLPPTDKPFTSNLSGQEFWQLRQSGYWPVGLVFGACSYYVHSDRTTRALMKSNIWSILFGRARRNQELTQFTQGFQDARELAVMRLTDEISQLGGKGAVGMEIDQREEVITYDPFAQISLFLGLFLAGVFLALFISVATSNSVGLILSVGVGFIAVCMLYGIKIWRIIMSSSGPFRDLLISFIAIGTAIVDEKVPTENPVSQTMIFYPLSQKR
jgi:uncharacterized protein YbjQ (UPF0145 family)